MNSEMLVVQPRENALFPSTWVFLSILAIHIDSQQVELLTREREITAAELNRLLFSVFLTPEILAFKRSGPFIHIPSLGTVWRACLGPWACLQSCAALIWTCSHHADCVCGSGALPGHT